MSAGTLRKLDDRLRQLDPDTTRYHVLAAVRQFRTSWVDLGRLLTEVAYGGDYKEWGYDDFETYCGRELGLKKPTVQKLMVSYNYLRRLAPERLAAYEDREGDAPPPDLPDYRTVELLHRAQESEELDEKQKREFHRLAFDDGAEETVLRKEIRGAVATARDPEAAHGLELDDIRRTCRVLRRKLAESRCVPEGLRGRFERLLEEIEALD